MTAVPGATNQNDTLFGTAGVDEFNGLDGFDFASYENVAGPVTARLDDSENNSGAAAGDTYVSIEGLIGTGADDTLVGDGNNNWLKGLDGNDILFGGAGADTLDGGAGHDGVFYNEAGAGVVVYLANNGPNEGDAAGDSFIDVEDASGTDLDDRIYGTAGENYLFGHGGNDVLDGAAGPDTLDGGAGNDTLYGGTGADSMIGGSGDDVFYVDDPEDVVNEEAGGGNDTIYTTIAGYTAANVENIIYVVASDPPPPAPGNPFRGTDGPNHINGDSGDNVIDGLGGNDVLKGGAGNDYIYGGSGNDRLEGGTGSDTLNGGSGNDTMYGGTGNDWYYVNSSRDKIVEGAGGGKDSVLASFSYSIAANPFLEDVYLLGTGNLKATGNGGSNHLVGNSGRNLLVGGGGNDILDGGAGADTMQGGTGNDRYYVDNTRDRVSEVGGNGTDHILSSVSYGLAGTGVERLTLTGSADINGRGDGGANTLVGNAGNNSLNGSGGNDKIYGGFGNDILTGGSGLDKFVFNTTLGDGNIDTIRDFSVKDDTILLENGVFTALGKPGHLSADAFHIGSQAQDAQDRVIYDKATGALYYDADGSGDGQAVQFAQLSAGLKLAAADFSIV